MGLGLLVCLGYAIHLKTVRPNVEHIPIPMAYEAHSNSLYSLGILLGLLGAILFVVPLLRAKSNQSKPPDFP